LNEITDDISLKNKFVLRSRDEMIDGYLKQTATKTRDFLDKCEGGIIFIENAYESKNSSNDRCYCLNCSINLMNMLKHKKLSVGW